MRGEATRVRDWALSGYWGREVHVIDGVEKYARGPVGANAPLSVWSNRWSTMPIARLPAAAHAAARRARAPRSHAGLDGAGDPPAVRRRRPPAVLGAWAQFSGNHLWNLREDPDENRNLAGTPAEKRAEELLRAALIEIEAPADQLARLGLA